ASAGPVSPPRIPAEDAATPANPAGRRLPDRRRVNRKLAKTLARSGGRRRQKGAAMKSFEAGRAAFQRGDYGTALAHWRQAADDGHAEALYRLGQLYSAGHGVTRDYLRAFELYLAAAELDHAEAEYALGVLHEHGLGVEIDPAEAAYWYARAVDQGHTSAMCNLAGLYERGLGVTQDYVKSLD